MSFSTSSVASIPEYTPFTPTWADEILGHGAFCADESAGPDGLEAGGESPVEGEPPSKGVDPAYVTESIFPVDEAENWMMPAYLSIFSLEELGMLYMLERMAKVTRPGALRLAQNRGLSLDSAHEVVDFHFSRKKTTCPEQAIQMSKDASVPEKPARRARKQDKATPDAPTVHTLGETGEIVCSLALKGCDTVQLHEDLVEELERTYPIVDVRMELMRMDQWLRANPEKRKTPRGVRRFINTWLSNASDRERTRRDMMHAGSAPRNGFGTGVGAPSVPDETARDGEDGLGDLLG